MNIPHVGRYGAKMRDHYVVCKTTNVWRNEQTVAPAAAPVSVAVAVDSAGNNSTKNDKEGVLKTTKDKGLSANDTPTKVGQKKRATALKKPIRNKKQKASAQGEAKVTVNMTKHNTAPAAKDATDDNSKNDKKAKDATADDSKNGKKAKESDSSSDSSSDSVSASDSDDDGDNDDKEGHNGSSGDGASD